MEVNEPTPLPTNLGVSPSTAAPLFGRNNAPVVKKRRINRAPKLSMEQLTNVSAVSSLVSVGRATAEEWDVVSAQPGAKNVEARMLSAVLRRATRWASSVAPRHSLSQFVMEARGLSTKRNVRAYLSNVRLAQLRGADVTSFLEQGRGIDDEPINDTQQTEIANENENGNENENDGNGTGNIDSGSVGAPVIAEAPDLDDIMEEEPTVLDTEARGDATNGKACATQTAVMSGGKIGADPGPEGDGWDEPDMFDLEPSNDIVVAAPASARQREEKAMETTEDEKKEGDGGTR